MFPIKLSFVPRLKIINDVTDRNRPTIFFGKRWKPRICPTEFFDFNSRYLENENEFFKNSFETVYRASRSRDRGQLVSAFQLTFNLIKTLTIKNGEKQRETKVDQLIKVTGVGTLTPVINQLKLDIAWEGNVDFLP